MKRIIRLTESDLHNIIENAVKRVLKEETEESHPYYERLNEYDVYYVLNEFSNGSNIWLPLINPSMYERALQEFTKYGKFVKFPTKYIYQWMGIIMKNTAILRACSELSGATRYFPIDDFIDFYFDGEDDKWEEYKNKNGLDEHNAISNILDEKGFYEWNRLPDGTYASTDYGLNPLEELISEYNPNMSPERVIVIINKILDVTHWNGDLASIFIQGGTKTLA